MTTTTFDDRTAMARPRLRELRKMIAGAAVFDGVMGIACLAAASEFGRWLAVGSSPVWVTGGIFLLAAAAGGFTLRRGATDIRLIAGANLLFAAWCLVMLAADSPNALGVVLLVGAALTSGATAIAELRLARSA